MKSELPAREKTDSLAFVRIYYALQTNSSGTGSQQILILVRFPLSSFGPCQFLILKSQTKRGKRRDSLLTRGRKVKQTKEFSPIVIIGRGRTGWLDCGL